MFIHIHIPSAFMKGRVKLTIPSRVPPIYHSLAGHIRRMFPGLPLGGEPSKATDHAARAFAQLAAGQHHLRQLHRVVFAERHPLQRVSTYSQSANHTFLSFPQFHPTSQLTNIRPKTPNQPLLFPAPP